MSTKRHSDRTWIGETCGSCHTDIGKRHLEGCDIERCHHCGGQRMMCGCSKKNVAPDAVWDGYWPDFGSRPKTFRKPAAKRKPTGRKTVKRVTRRVPQRKLKPGTIVPWPTGGEWHGVVQTDGSLRRFKGRMNARSKQINRWLAQGRNPDDGSRAKRFRGGETYRAVGGDGRTHAYKAKRGDRRPAKHPRGSTKSWTKGTMHRALRVPQGKRIPTSKLKAALRRGGVVAKRARKLLNLRGVKTKSL